MATTLYVTLPSVWITPLVTVALVLVYVVEFPDIFAPVNTYDAILEPLPAVAVAVNFTLDLPST